MPETIDIPEVTADSIETPEIDATEHHEIDTIGVEFEYPLGDGTPSDGTNSRNLYDEIGYNDWVLPDSVPRRVPRGEMTSDHVGAEITSAQMNLHSDEPELWYAGTIQQAEEMGYPFARTGYGSTTFGLHMHLSEIPAGKAEALYEMCQEPWMKVFVCTSLSEESCDPWRHGGVNSSNINGSRGFNESQYCVSARRGRGHYEWRLPEPMAMDHFMVVMNFLRRLEDFGAENAEEYARGLVEDADSRLTAVKQYRMMEQSDDYDFPNESMLIDNREELRGAPVMEDTAEYFHGVMQDND